MNRIFTAKRRSLTPAEPLDARASEVRLFTGQNCYALLNFTSRASRPSHYRISLTPPPFFFLSCDATYLSTSRACSLHYPLPPLFYLVLQLFSAFLLLASLNFQYFLGYTARKILYLQGGTTEFFTRNVYIYPVGNLIECRFYSSEEKKIFEESAVGLINFEESGKRVTRKKGKRTRGELNWFSLNL